MCRNLPCRALPLTESCRSVGLSSLGTGIWRGFCSVGTGLPKPKESAKASRLKSIILKERKAAIGGICYTRAQRRTAVGTWAEPGSWRRRRRRRCRLRQKDRISDDLDFVIALRRCLASDGFGAQPCGISSGQGFLDCSSLSLASFFLIKGERMLMKWPVISMHLIRG